VVKVHTGLWISELRPTLTEVAKNAGLEGSTRVHDLRHTRASHMHMNGVDQVTVAAILEYQYVSTTPIYTHQSAEHLKKSIEKIGL